MEVGSDSFGHKGSRQLSMCGLKCVFVSPGRYICGEGDAVGYEGQWRGPCDVLPLGRGCPSCMKQGTEDELTAFPSFHLLTSSSSICPPVAFHIKVGLMLHVQ